MKKTTLIYSLVVFILLSVFFIVLHPIAIFDTDDWEHIFFLRLPIPAPFTWNPIKVYPELAMTIFSSLGAWICYPITGNYVYSLSISNGLFISAVITVYFVEFLLFVKNKYELSDLKSILISILFIGCHFFALAGNASGNNFLFYAYDLNCVYNYNLCTFTAAALVMHMIRNGGFDNFKNLTKRHKNVIRVWVYLSLCSNLYTSVVLAAYVGTELVFNLIADKKTNQFSVADYRKKNKPQLIILVLWLVTMVLEKTGSRSAWHEGSIIGGLKEGLYYLVGWLKEFNIAFIVFACIVVVAWIVFVKEKDWLSTGKYIVALMLTGAYIMLLSAAVGGYYVGRADVIAAAGYWTILLLVLLFVEIVKNVKISEIIMGAVACASVVLTVCYINSYKEINYVNIPYEQCEAVANDIISQFKTAESNGQSEMVLEVPLFEETSDNWPMGTYGGDSLAKALVFHRVVNGYITVTEVVPSEEMYQKYIADYIKEQ